MLRKLKRHRPLDLPSDRRQLPDVFLMLESGGERVGFVKLAASSVVADRFNRFEPRWVTLVPTATRGRAEQAGISLPMVLVSLSLVPCMASSPGAATEHGDNSHGAAADAADADGGGGLFGSLLGGAEEPAEADMAPTPAIRWPPSRSLMPTRSTLAAYELRVHLWSGH